MKKILQIITVSAVACILLTLSVFAENGITCQKSLNGNEMTITGTVGEAISTEVLLRVAKYTESALNLDTDVIYIEQLTTNPNGEFSFSFKFPESNSVVTTSEPTQQFTPDKYVFSIGAINKLADYDSEIIEYYGEGYRNSIKAGINGAKVNQTSNAVKNILENEYSRLYLNAELYEAYIAQTQDYDGISAYIIKIPQLATLNDFKLQLDEAAAICELKRNSGATTKIFEMLNNSSYQEALGLKESTAMATFNDFKNVCGTEMALNYATADFTGVEGSKTAFEFSVISCALLESLSSTQVENILTQNEGLLKIDVDAYGLSNSELLKLAGYEITALTDVKEKIAQIIAERNSGNNQSPGYGGGYGGGGGGGASVGGMLPNFGGLALPVADNNDNISNSKAFSDLEGFEWAEESIEILQEKGIINGRSENMFAPGESVSREEYVKMLLLGLDIEINKNEAVAFSDVDANEWYTPYISTAVKEEVVMGISDSRFGVGEAISREDAAVLTFRALNKFGYDSSKQNNTKFTDADSISDYAVSAVEFMVSATMINGYEDSSFRPNNSITRAEASVIIARMLSFTGLDK